MKPWVIKNFHYMSIHFHIRNAELVARILEQETDVGLWNLYAMLGSYAFVSYLREPHCMDFPGV